MLSLRHCIHFVLYLVNRTISTSHDYVYVADVECQVMFSLVTFYYFMCNSALVTFLGLLQ